MHAKKEEGLKIPFTLADVTCVWSLDEGEVVRHLPRPARDGIDSPPAEGTEVVDPLVLKEVVTRTAYDQLATPVCSL